MAELSTPPMPTVQLEGGDLNPSQSLPVGRDGRVVVPPCLTDLVKILASNIPTSAYTGTLNSTI